MVNHDQAYATAMDAALATGRPVRIGRAPDECGGAAPGALWPNIEAGGREGVGHSSAVAASVAHGGGAGIRPGDERKTGRNRRADQSPSRGMILSWAVTGFVFGAGIVSVAMSDDWRPSMRRLAEVAGMICHSAADCR